MAVSETESEQALSPRDRGGETHGRDSKNFLSKILYRIRSMQTTKTCSRCGSAKPITDFSVRAASKDGFTAACSRCLRDAKQIAYWSDPAERKAASRRAVESKAARFAFDPAYKRAFNLWGSTAKRTKIPSWVKIVDFLPICREALARGRGWEIDHVIPINHPKVCGLHVPQNVQLLLREANSSKANHWEP